jgi:hypothetical protein
MVDAAITSDTTTHVLYFRYSCIYDTNKHELVDDILNNICSTTTISARPSDDPMTGDSLLKKNA